MKFLTNAKLAAMAPKDSLISVLRKNLSGFEEDRPHEVVHASDVTKHEFCARQFCLFHETKKTKKDVYINTALRVTFDLGHAVSELVRAKWLGQAAIGHWRCHRCGERREFCSRPAPLGKEENDFIGATIHEHRWEYEEVEFTDPATGISGSIDALAALGGLKLFIVEVKIMAPDQWEKLVAPLAEHRVRTHLYMGLVRRSGSPYAPLINTDEAKVLYISRAYGKKDPEHKEILPFKEFTVQYDEATVAPALAKGALVHRYHTMKHKPMPKGICGSQADPVAMKCAVRKECFSGQYPACES